MTAPKVGEVRAVSGGYGLMLVVDADAHFAQMRGHGPAETMGHWFPVDRLGDAVGPEVVLKERAEARARRVDCNNPDCWCRSFK